MKTSSHLNSLLPPVKLDLSTIALEDLICTHDAGQVVCTLSQMPLTSFLALWFV
jgi:hypothetical protein